VAALNRQPKRLGPFRSFVAFLFKRKPGFSLGGAEIVAFFGQQRHNRSSRSRSSRMADRSAKRQVHASSQVRSEAARQIHIRFECAGRFSRFFRLLFRQLLFSAAFPRPPPTFLFAVQRRQRQFWGSRSNERDFEPRAGFRFACALPHQHALRAIWRVLLQRVRDLPPMSLPCPEPVFAAACLCDAVSGDGPERI